MLFDSHCHPQFPQYDKDREEMLARAFGAGVSMICVGTDLEMSKRGIELAQKHDGIWATVGVHPNDLDNLNSESLNAFSTLLAMAKSVENTDDERNDKKDRKSWQKIVAIGEVGLDYYRTPEPEKQKKQKEVFEQFIDLAQRTKKPMVLHFRDSPKGSSGRVHKDAIEILALSFKPKALSQTGVSHSFTGTKDEARKYLELGFYLGFNGIITFRSSFVALREGGAGMYDEVVRYAPLEQILLETDAPYLTPEPYRGGRNEPTYVVEVAKKIAELKNESLEKVIAQTTENCKKLFNIVS